MTRREAAELVDEFPQITPEIEKALRQELPNKFLIFGKEKAFCTACEEKISIDECYTPVKHRQETYCPLCGKRVTAIYNCHNFCGSVVESEVNVGVFLSSPENDNLYVRCYTVRLFFNARELMPHISLFETQRYLFTDKQAYRYGPNYEWHYEDGFYNKDVCGWSLRTRFTDPVFPNNKRYHFINYEAIFDTVCRNSAVNSGFLYYKVLIYIKFWQAHKGAERFIKCGLERILDNYTELIDWTQTEPHKMLGVTKDVFRAIRERRIELNEYRDIKRELPELTDLNKIIQANKCIRFQFGSLYHFSNRLKISKYDMLNYLLKQNAFLSDYRDYYELACKVGCNMNDAQVKFPRNLKAAHDRVLAMKNAIEMEKQAKLHAELQKSFDKLKKQRKELEYRSGSYLIRQPLSVEEIVAEGQALKHCVGGYAERHVNGELTIMFLRQESEPEKPFYTIEVSKDYRIVQCRGFRNNWVNAGGSPKPQEIIDFEKEYQQYLNRVARKHGKTRRKQAC